MGSLAYLIDQHSTHEAPRLGKSTSTKQRENRHARRPYHLLRTCHILPTKPDICNIHHTVRHIFHNILRTRCVGSLSVCTPYTTILPSLSATKLFFVLRRVGGVDGLQRDTHNKHSSPQPYKSTTFGTHPQVHKFHSATRSMEATQHKSSLTRIYKRTT